MERINRGSESGVNGVERLLGVLLERTQNLQDDVSEMKDTVDSLKTKSSIHKGVMLGAASVAGVAGGTLGSKVLAALFGAFPK